LQNFVIKDKNETKFMSFKSSNPTITYLEINKIKVYML
jgi:hypothetical protein